MTIEQILTALTNLAERNDYEALGEIRKAAEEFQDRIKKDAIKRAESMGVRCEDGNGKKQRRPRAAKQDPGEVIEQ